MLSKVGGPVLTLLGLISSGGVLHATSQPIQREVQEFAHRHTPGFVSVWAERDRPYSRGDEARIYLRTDRPAYVTVLRVDTDGRLRMLFPREPGGRSHFSGGRVLEVTRPPDGRSFRVDDYPGIGYLLAIASSSPFDYDDITRGDHWDYRAIEDGRVKGDPYVALADFAASIARKGDYRYDIAPYYVEHRYQYPRFVCYDCHSYASYQDWDPYASSCARFRVVIYDDPSYYPYRYNQGRNVVVDRPFHPAPRYVFKDAHPGEDYVTRLRGSAIRLPDRAGEQGRTSADVGGPGAIPAPGVPEARRRAAERTLESDAWRRRQVDEARPAAPSRPEESREAQGRTERRRVREEPREQARPAEREPRKTPPVERAQPTPQSTGEPELRRRKPDSR